MLELQLKREARTLTEGFFLYRLIVLCPEQTKSRQQTKTLNTNRPRQSGGGVQRAGG